ncbi:MAG: hypothetical protein AB8F78_10820 [Saprospiraceae bacterium]
MNLDTAAIIGLSRQPLDEETQGLAAQLMDQTGNPAEEALALLAAKSLAHLANLSKAAVQEIEVPESIPEHPDYQLIERHLFNYLEASLAFRGSADVKTFFDCGLVIPASKIPWFLEAVIRRTNVEPEAFSLLGRRGLWLSLKHPSFKRKVAFLQAETFPKSEKQRAAYVNFWWSELLRSETEREGAADYRLVNRFRALFTSAKLVPRTFGLLQKILDQGVLTEVVRPKTLMDLFSRKHDLTDLEVLRIECKLDEDRSLQMFARARTVLSSLPDGCDQRDTFEVLAKAAISSRSSSAAATLLQHAATSKDRLIQGQKSLPQLAGVLGQPAYADLMDYAHDCYPKGWRDPMVVAFIEASPHTFSTKLSEDLANEAVHGYAPPAETISGRYPHKLNPQAFGHLLSLRQAQGGLTKQDTQPDTLNALIAMMLAKQRVIEAFPVAQ